MAAWGLGRTMRLGCVVLWTVSLAVGFHATVRGQETPGRVEPTTPNGSLRDADSEAMRKRVIEAVTKALPLLKTGSEGHLKQRSCFACHQQTHPLLAMRGAEARMGLAIDDAFVAANAQHTLKFLARNEAAYRKGNGQGGQADTAGYALWTLELARVPPNETTSAVAEYLIQYQADWGYWRTSSQRPPSEASHFTTTYVALRGLKFYATEAQQDRAKERIAKAKAWLEKTPPSDTEDAVFRLRGLRVVEADPQIITQAADAIWDLQREGGGWGQTPQMEPDAYATGSAMATLAEVDGKAAFRESYRKGVEFLLTTQLADGTWRVATRSKPFQEYFETGFPHEKDQFISSAATGWAVAALTEACREDADHASK